MTTAEVHRVYRKALREGRLVRPSTCERCGSGKRLIHGHHDDYSKPLEVRWLCGMCHQIVHKEKRMLATRPLPNMENLRARRRAANLSQQGLADRADCSVAMIRLLERGYVPTTGSVVVPRIFAALDEMEVRA